MDQAPQGPQFYPTRVVLGFVTCIYAWLTELALVGFHIFFGRIPVESTLAHILLISVATIATIYARSIGRQHHQRLAHLRGQIPLTPTQTAIITTGLIAYVLLVVWALGGAE